MAPLPDKVVIAETECTDNISNVAGGVSAKMGKRMKGKSKQGLAQNSSTSLSTSAPIIPPLYNIFERVESTK